MDTKIYKAFIASPSDTEQERRLCDKIFEEINSGLGEHFKFRVESLKWEKDVKPTIKDQDAQSIIFDQIGNTYEIFIGIMNKKFGSPTPRAGSGTEEEFNEAFKRYKEKNDIEIIFYFNEEPPLSMKDLAVSELLKIENFRKSLQPSGIYGFYNGISDFEEKLRKHLTKYFINIFKQNSRTFDADEIIKKETLKKIFKKRFNDSLKGFDEQPQVWIEPILIRGGKISKNPEENFSNRVLIEEILHTDKSYFINAPAQFGLSTLGHYLVIEAWDNNELWIYLDNSHLKPNACQKAVINETISLEQDIKDVKCIIFDSFLNNDKVSQKKLKSLIESNPSLRIIVLNTVDEQLYIDKDQNDKIDQKEVLIEKSFEILHLIALPRSQVRNIVKQYNAKRNIGEETTVLNKITRELESLNLHRTPYNIITILKVSEKYFDDSPVNRTKMIEMILFVLFDLGAIPRYKTMPDLKDCEYVLGRYCEIMLKSEVYTFKKDEFVTELKNFCKEKYIDLDIEVVFEILRNNNIIIFDCDRYRFKSTFWIYYFGAKRMHSDPDFKNYIMESKKYTSIPDIIEFYTGIDRNRDDALAILLNDISATRAIVEEKLGIKSEINPLNNIKWNPTTTEIEKIQDEIGENVISSNLPEALKDQFLDKTYNQIQPYNQSIHQILEDYSLVSLMQQIKASSTALRNSDYSDPNLKKLLLVEIYNSWRQLMKVLFALSPTMAQQGKAIFQGAAFELYGDFGETFEDRLKTVLQVLPTNVVGYFQDHLYSPKIGPLFFECFDCEENEIVKHLQALLIISKRPNGWKEQIEKYIISVSKNSYYLYDTISFLKIKYSFDFVNPIELKNIKYLVKLGLAKHHFGGNKPSMAQVIKIDDSNLPRRECIE